jgi:enoyl-CoA hydratase/carnithine racemase
MDGLITQCVLQEDDTRVISKLLPNGLGTFTFDRPQALNAADKSMNRKILTTLRNWAGNKGEESRCVSL